ncbi:MAG: hypothetical protein KGI70_01140 [Patescibacteria group bacterium]|nr:hypothetical protein [Patescibacteria group bacterium]
MNTASFILSNGDFQNLDVHFLAHLNCIGSLARTEFRVDGHRSYTHLAEFESTLSTMATDTNWGRLYADFWKQVEARMETNHVHGQKFVKIALRTCSDTICKVGVPLLDTSLVEILFKAVVEVTVAHAPRKHKIAA